MFGGENMKSFYKFMDTIFDPLPKELKKESGNTRKMLYYQAEDKSYRWYKHLCYRNLILEASVAFFLGVLVAVFVELV